MNINTVEKLVEKDHLSESKILTLLRFKSKLQQTSEKIKHEKSVYFTLEKTQGLIKKLLFIFIFISILIIFTIYYSQEFIILYEYLILTTNSTINISINLLYPAVKNLIEVIS